jgi:hypothetical protein
MALTKTNICNQALGRVGSPHVLDIEDVNSKSARVCKETFELAVREVARAGEWNCLKKREALSRLTEAPAFEWAYQFQLPINFISLVELNGVEVTGSLGETWEIEGDKLLTDAEEAKVRFIGYDEETHKWDALFVNAVVVLLASKIALPIRQDDALAQALLSEYQRVSLPQARMKDGNERKKKRFAPWEDSRFVQARRYSTNG